VSLQNRASATLRTILGGSYANDSHGDDTRREHFVGVRWLDTRPIAWPFWEKGLYSNRVIVTRPDKLLWQPTLKRLKQAFPNFDS
jgi:hypothetical protein